MTENTDLVQRLRTHVCSPECGDWLCKIMREAADRIEALEKRVSSLDVQHIKVMNHCDLLQAALREMIDRCEWYKEPPCRSNCNFCPCYEARRALGGTP